MKNSKWVFSNKQLLAMYWWEDDEWSQADGIIAHGSVRSGKTLSMAFGFLEWAKNNYSEQNFGLCGKTIASFERNVLGYMKTYARAMGWKWKYVRSPDHCVTITYGSGKWNCFYIFGGKDEGSQDLIQGITLAGVFLDEVALMPESFVNQALARLSVTDAKVWMNCNPAAPSHFVKTEYIDKSIERNYIVTHFTMEDNLSLSKERRDFYMKQWVGVFYRRYVLGEWVAAEGAIYEIYSADKDRFRIERTPRFTRISVGLDYGASQSRCALECTGITADRHLVSLCEGHLEGIHSPEDIYEFTYNFLLKVEKLYSKAQVIFCDYGALGQVLTKGLQNYIRRKGYVVQISDCKKGEIIDRILLTLRLMGEGRYHISGLCPQLSKAFENALWEEDKEDTRLDNGTSDIDSLDAFEYSFFSFGANMLS